MVRACLSSSPTTRGALPLGRASARRASRPGIVARRRRAPPCPCAHRQGAPRLSPETASASTSRRRRTWRRSSRTRTPSVDVSVKHACITLVASRARASTRKSESGRPFLPKRVPIDTSRTPPSARRRSPAMPISSPVMSSTSNSRIVTKSASVSSDRLRIDQLEHQGAHDVGSLGERARACAAADGTQPAAAAALRGTLAAARDGGGWQRRSASRARRRCRRRARGSRRAVRSSPAREPAAVRARSSRVRRPAAAASTSSVAPSRCAAMQPAATTSMSESQSASSWKCTLSTCGSVHFRLRFAEEREERERVRPRRRIERRVADRARPGRDTRCPREAGTRYFDGKPNAAMPIPALVARGNAGHRRWSGRQHGAALAGSAPRAPAGRRPWPRRTCRRRCRRRGRGGSTSAWPSGDRRGRHTVLRG